MKAKILIPNEKESTLEQEIIRLINKVVKEKIIDLASDDIKLIAKELMPDIDRIIANKMGQHFVEIGNFLVKRFSNTGE